MMRTKTPFFFAPFPVNTLQDYSRLPDLEININIYIDIVR